MRDRPFTFTTTVPILQCQSTMNVVRALSEEEQGLTVVSVQQYSGKGRTGNEWLSSPGGLYFSFLLKPMYGPHLNKDLYLLTAQSVISVIQSYLPTQKIEFKVPNDVLVGGKKISGVLIEAKAEGTRNLFVIVGIGINVFNPVPEIGTSLKLEGTVGVTTEEVLQKFQQQFEVNYREWIIQSTA